MRCLSTTFIGLTALLLAERVQAIDIGECDTPEGITATMKAEGQHSIAHANIVKPDKSVLGVIFSANSDLSIGYIVEADKPIGTKSSRVCVRDRMANVRLFDARKPGLSPNSLLSAPEHDAYQRCDELAEKKIFPRDACGSLNTMLRLVEPNRERVITQGLSTQKQKDGTYKPSGSLITVTGHIDGSTKDFPNNPVRGIVGSILYSSLPDGATVIDATLIYARYTPYGLSLLDGPSPKP